MSDGHTWATVKEDALHRYQVCSTCGRRRIGFLSKETGKPDLSFLSGELKVPTQLELPWNHGD